ncbi:hypothetical protein QYF61_001143 [Mycteria americana]|uniref:Uncharacterized protein n=1 Tax=Mycteria americana TaxID=33587 RepID=A0AAN7MH61_MYCAM|nr:hypothetical protein QYF61_001143 [Mycteria americana]
MTGWEKRQQQCGKHYIKQKLRFHLKNVRDQVEKNNETGNDTSTPPLEIGLTIGGLLILLAGVHKKLRGGTAKTVDPNRPKGYSIPYNVMLSIETGGSWLGGSDCCSGTGWASILSPIPPGGGMIDENNKKKQVTCKSYGSPTIIPDKYNFSERSGVTASYAKLHCPSLDTLQHLNVSLVVGGPKMNTVFEVRPHQCRVQGHDHCPSPAGHTIPDTSQDAIGFLGRLGTLLAHIQVAVNQHPQVLLCQAAFQPLFPKPVALHGVAVAQVQDLALGLVKPHTIDLSPSIQPVQVLLQSLPTLQQINTPTQLGVICKLTEGALDPLIQIIDKDVKQDWPQHRTLGTPLVTGRQLDLPPFTTTLWARPSSQFFTQRRVHRPKP